MLNIRTIPPAIEKLLMQALESYVAERKEDKILIPSATQEQEVIDGPISTGTTNLERQKNVAQFALAIRDVRKNYSEYFKVLDTLLYAISGKVINGLLHSKMFEAITNAKNTYIVESETWNLELQKKLHEYQEKETEIAQQQLEAATRMQEIRQLLTTFYDLKQSPSDAKAMETMKQTFKDLKTQLSDAQARVRTLESQAVDLIAAKNKAVENGAADRTGHQRLSDENKRLKTEVKELQETVARLRQQIGVAVKK